MCPAKLGWRGRALDAEWEGRGRRENASSKVQKPLVSIKQPV